MQNSAKSPTFWQGRIETFLALHTVQYTIVSLIVINALLLGLETSEEIMSQYGSLLHLIDHIILGIFIVELILLMSARGLSFFKDAWCLFDFIVIAIALVPASGSLSVIRSLRVLRILRLINKFESMRKVVNGLLGSLASLGSVVGLMLIVFYVAAVVSTNLFGKEFPDYFGDLGASFFTLFQVMTLESWSNGIARPVMEKFPQAWIFFLTFIMLSTFVVINLFTAAIVDSFGSDTDSELENKRLEEFKKKAELKEQKLMKEINDEFIAIQEELLEVKQFIKQIGNKTSAS